METLSLVLSIVASGASIWAAVQATSANTRITALEQKLVTSSVAGGQRVKGDGNFQVGGNMNG